MTSITKVLITWNIKENLLEDLKSQFPNVRFDVKLNEQEIDDNVRGNVFKEQELIDALKKRQVAGAGLDVFVTEPLPEDSPFYGLEQVLLSPHISGATPYSASRTVRIFAENLKRFQSQLPLLNLVNKKAGY
ncbi:NAD(P)-dependent oxidoreductase [Paenibacillus filicis]|uniref:NAD(P)-dependent oxidoreductase n=1 Tax=Paenibacillus gyeongsangnamensis TaxID=3388067 RepID=A0ABT4QK54_9BACL|nr:NAD(P)-dependent oxidoreductase [Paenibacillus filicis]MCZ8517086.1 NAD(P)-dependent oxidoreductase [Paenibacillus filicis]